MSESIQVCAAAPDLRRATTRELVHKLHDDEVLLAGWRQESPHTYLITAAWPHGRVYYAPRHGALDPLLVTETIRQAGLLVSHVGGEVPLGQHFIWENLEFTLAAAALRSQDGTGVYESEVEVRAHVLDAVRRGSHVKRLDLGFTLTRQATPLATGTVRVSFQDPQVYRRIRGGAGDIAAALARALPAPPPIPARLTGRQRPEDVVLSAADGHPGARTVWQLRLDTDHPVLFDHPMDHAPGTALVDAARQAAQAFHHPTATVVTAVECEFNRYVELDQACLVEVEPLPARLLSEPRVRVRFRQFGTEPSCTVDVTLRPVIPAQSARHACLPVTALPAQDRPLAALFSS